MNVLCTVLDGRDEQVIDFRDVTAAKELEDAKDLFLATTSHELRTPITVVQGFASTLANRWDKLVDADRRGAVQTIAERAESLGRLVDQLLLGSRAGANRLTVSHEPFDLARVLLDAAAVFRPLSDNHVVVAEIPDDLPAAHGDGAATDSIVSQLLENALKYSPDGGAITISARAEPDSGQIVVTVLDEGIGIAAADLERVFDRFVQGDAGDRRRFGGIGLGLYIVRQLARAQGGEVTAARRPDGGTAMTLTLPRASALLPGAADPGPDEVHANGVAAVDDHSSRDVNGSDAAGVPAEAPVTSGAHVAGRTRARSAVPWSSLARPSWPHPRKPLDDRGTAGTGGPGGTDGPVSS